MSLHPKFMMAFSLFRNFSVFKINAFFLLVSSELIPWGLCLVNTSCLYFTGQQGQIAYWEPLGYAVRELILQQSTIKKGRKQTYQSRQAVMKIWSNSLYVEVGSFLFLYKWFVSRAQPWRKLLWKAVIPGTQMHGLCDSKRSTSSSTCVSQGICKWWRWYLSYDQLINWSAAVLLSFFFSVHLLLGFFLVWANYKLSTGTK